VGIAATREKTMTTAHVVDDRQARRARPLLARGVLGPPLLVVALVEGATRSGYSTWRSFGSQLSTGPWGWTQITNFVVCGLLVCCAAVGFRQVRPTGTGATWDRPWLACPGCSWSLG
jgi:hypothetical protein